MKKPIDTSFEEVSFELTDKIIPYVRMSQRSQYVEPLARRYIAERNSLRDSLAWECLFRIRDGTKSFIETIKSKKGSSYVESEITLLIPARVPFAMSVTFINHYAGKKCDLDNLLKSVLDAGNKIIFADDRWCDQMTATRCIDRSDYSERTIVKFMPIKGDD